VCQRLPEDRATPDVRSCDYGAPNPNKFSIHLRVWNAGGLEFSLSFAGSNDGTNRDGAPVNREFYHFDAVAIYGSDMTRAIDAMKPILGQTQFGFEEVQIEQCLQVSPSEIVRRRDLQFENKDWTLDCRNGQNERPYGVNLGGELDVKVRRTPPPPTNKF
jgi:hypothetical protein